MKKKKTEIKKKNSHINSKRNLKKGNTIFEITYLICNFNNLKCNTAYINGLLLYIK